MGTAGQDLLRRANLDFFEEKANLDFSTWLMVFPPAQIYIWLFFIYIMAYVVNFLEKEIDPMVTYG